MLAAELRRQRRAVDRRLAPASGRAICRGNPYCGRPVNNPFGERTIARPRPIFATRCLCWRSNRKQVIAVQSSRSCHSYRSLTGLLQAVQGPIGWTSCASGAWPASMSDRMSALRRQKRAYASGLGNARDQRLVEAFGVRHLRRVTEFRKLDEFSAGYDFGGRFA